MTASVLVPVSADLVNALDVSSAFTGATLQTRGASWVEFGSYGAEPFPTLLPNALGFAGILNRGRAGRRPQDNAQIMANTANPYAWDTAFVGPALLHEPGNSLIEADTPANRRAALESVRAMVALMSASARVEQTGWTYRDNANGESWGPDNAQAYASGGSLRAGFFTGLQVDIPVTAGTSYLLCHGIASTTGGRGATVRITQNGVQVAEKSLDDITVATPGDLEAREGVSPAVVRLPNLDAGTVTLTVDQLGVAGSVALLDALLPQAAAPRTVILVKPVTLNAPTHSKPDLLAYLRTVPDLVAAEFGAHVIVVDPQPGWNPATMLGADGLHPTPAGTAHIRDAIVTTLRARAYGERARVVEPTVWYSVGDPTAQRRVTNTWKDAPLWNVELVGMLLDIAKEQVIEYAPHGEPAAEVRHLLERLHYTAPQVAAALSALGVAPSVDTDPPTRYVWAQLQQAKHMWNAGRVAANGETGADGFSFAPRPLDKDIQRIIRPTAGVPSVF